MRTISGSVIASMALVLVLAAGCAKRPAVYVAPAPAPPAAPPVVAAPPPPPVVAAPPSPAPAPPPAAVAPPPPPVVVAPPAPREYRADEGVKMIHFDFDDARIRPGDARILDANPSFLLLIEGHCDQRGTGEYNLALGDRRAKATMNYLVGQGIASDRITTISYGEEQPLCGESKESCWSKNRRAQFRVKER
jgi:peptidoglycan-associated lipoprotein